jgi:hypothetical protein
MEKKNLFLLSEDEKYQLLKMIYSKVTESQTGRLLISTKYCQMCAEMLGGNYNNLTKLGKFFFRSDITGGYINENSDFSKYVKFR